MDRLPWEMNTCVPPSSLQLPRSHFSQLPEVAGDLGGVSVENISRAAKTLGLCASHSLIWLCPPLSLRTLFPDSLATISGTQKSLLKVATGNRKHKIEV